MIDAPVDFFERGTLLENVRKALQKCRTQKMRRIVAEKRKKNIARIHAGTEQSYTSQLPKVGQNPVHSALPGS